MNALVIHTARPPPHPHPDHPKEAKDTETHASQGSKVEWDKYAGE